ncbi:MAG: hypothetical protein ACAH83_12580 [Alphaproteobacteria bacterium]
MADTLPSNNPFKLPEDVTTLAQMRDQLSDYLNTLERNTDAINLWLQKNQPQLIMGHHQLVRAIKYRQDEQAALQTLTAFGDAAGFVLSVGDFAALSDAAFGKDSRLSQEIRRAQVGVPPKILEELPEIKLPDPNAPPKIIAPPPPPPEPEIELEKKKWWQPSGWFKKDNRPEAPDPEIAAEEDRRRAEELRRHWRLVRSELIGLQSDRHYYIDSFMNWVGETLAPEKVSATPNVDKLMEAYQSPQYVIDLARADYDQVINVKAQGVRDKAAAYSATASLIDEQKIGDFIALLPSMFPKTETNESKQLKEYLLQDFGVASFADMALTRVKSRADQLLLFEAAMKYEPEIKLTGYKAKREIFEYIFAQTTDAKDPLDSRAVKIALDKMKTGKDDLADLIGLKSGAPKTVFERLVDRFKASAAAARTAMEQLIDGLGDNRDKAQDNLVHFMDAVAQKDAPRVGRLLDSMAQGQAGHKFMALWELSHPPGSAPLVAQVESTAKNKTELATLMDKALSAGILDEIKINSNAVNGSASNFFTFFNKHVMPPTGDFSLNTARKLMAASFANGGLDKLRTELTQAHGWLEQAASSKLSQDGKLNWIAALLEPFQSDAAKANILFEAANAKGVDPAAAAVLSSLEKNFAGNNVRLSDGKIMTNLDRIANIWYNAETKAMRYTVNGTGQTFMEGLSPVEAREVLTLLQRKGGFMSEYDGIYKPENIDRIASDQNGTKITWNRHTGELNVDQPTLDALHARDDFAHITGKNGATLSINQKSIALLQPLSDGTHLLVDRYGSVQILDGVVSLKAQPPLLDLSGTWFNPKNAALLQLNAGKNTLEFRCESNDFDDLLESAAPDQYFYPVELATKADFQKLEKAIAADDMISAPGGKSLQQLHFNFAQLGYLMFTDSRDTGFTCRKYGPTKKPGFISAEEDLARSIFAGLSSNPSLVCVENVITHKACVDDAYYNADKEHFYMLVGNDILQIPCEEAPAYKILKKLANEDGFAVVGANYIQGPAGAVTEVPADVVQMKHATMLFYSSAQDKTFVVADSDKFPISLDAPQSRDLFDLIEKQGLEHAKAATVKTAWTQNLKDALNALPAQQVRIAPSLTELSREYLLQQVLGEQTESRPMPNPQADFSIASAPLKANDNLAYPVREKTPAKRAPKPF